MTYEEIRQHAKQHNLNVILPDTNEFLGKEYYDNMRHIVGITVHNFKEHTAGYDRDGTVFVVGISPRDVKGYIRGIADMLARSGTPYRHTYSTNTIQVAR